MIHKGYDGAVSRRLLMIEKITWQDVGAVCNRTASHPERTAAKSSGYDCLIKTLMFNSRFSMSDAEFIRRA